MEFTLSVYNSLTQFFRLVYHPRRVFHSHTVQSNHQMCIRDRSVIQPIINKKTMKWALSIPLLDGQIYGQIRKKLIDALGGRFKEVRFADC